ncbi:hypothetical protein DRP53_01140 [candidate division WOR-3 bacterium]|uniref:Gingipain domain-containing protein n=1 Tax=candidate division WOR-3 bacterium TaxID=2052148 RepID=A0A660SM20_UNCW3|nr:MAG: hypothetical protein DRP53_01140 [candidate division WOR-3 bacterium]
MKHGIAVILMVSVIGLYGGEKIIEINGEPAQLRIESDGCYDHLSYSGGIRTGPPGAPGLPLVPIVVVLPQGAEKVNLEIIQITDEEVPGYYRPFPYQKPIPLNQNGTFTPPDLKTYQSQFPAQPVQLTGVGNLYGYRVASLLFYPVRYEPEGRLYLHRSIRLRLSYQIGGEINTASVDQLRSAKTNLRRMVLNPQDLDIYGPATFDRDGYREVFITAQDLVSSLEPLRYWRTKQGIPCTTVVAADIQNQYPGYDGPEKLRNFIIDVKDKWGAEYFLMVGDVGKIPYRFLGTPDSSMPSDHYFADLDGDWDANGNHIYGEWPDDSMDMYHDVFVGRFSVETPSECQTVVNKILTYEKNPPSGYLKKALLPAVLLGGHQWGDEVNDSIANCTPPGWQDIKLYQSQNNLTRSAVINEINSGVGFVHYAAHGNENGTYWAGGVDTVLHSTDVLNLTNGNKLGIHNAIACISGGFDLGEVNNDCFAEHLHNHSGGGAVAVIMNTRVGFFYPSGGMGPSEYLSFEFYRKAFREQIFRIGETHFFSKDVYVPTNDFFYMFCICELTLFGDPAMPMWFDEPKNQTVTHPDSIPLGNQNYTVTVTDGSSPIEDALVCIMTKKGEIYQYDYTNASGQITFQINPTTPDTMWVTSTALNFKPYEGFTVIGHPQVGEARSHRSLSFHLSLAPSILTDRMTISYGLTHTTHLTLSVLDIDGRVLAKLIDQDISPGHHQFQWDGTINHTRLSNGIYFLRLEAGNEYRLKKLIIMR